jgi:AI-2 transport protein TqsA
MGLREGRMVQAVRDKNEPIMGTRSPLLRFLLTAACVVIIMWGIRNTSHLLSVLLLSVLLAYGFVPLPRWLMQRFHLGKHATIGVTVGLLGSLGLFCAFIVWERVPRLKGMLPVYHEHFMVLYQSWVTFLNAHGIDFASMPASKLSSPEAFAEAARPYFPQAGSLLADGLTITLLALILVVDMIGAPGEKRGYLAEVLEYYGGDIQRYIAVSVKTGLATAVVNLVLFLVVGVNFPILWCVLYFFLHFIPNVGFIFAIVPPAFMTLLMSGWQRALLVVGGMVLTQILSDYVLTPLLMKKEVHISFLEVTVSLLFWGFLLGPAGAVLAIPLTLVVRRFLQQLMAEGDAVAT